MKNVEMDMYLHKHGKNQLYKETNPLIHTCTHSYNGT